MGLSELHRITKLRPRTEIGKSALVWPAYVRAPVKNFQSDRTPQKVSIVAIINSGVAQWLACWAHNPKVRGSKPRSAIFALLHINAFAQTTPLNQHQMANACMDQQIRGSIVVSISACHAEDPGSIPGRGVFGFPCCKETSLCVRCNLQGHVACTCSICGQTMLKGCSGN